MSATANNIQPENPVSAAEARKLGVEGLRDLLAENEEYLEQISHITPQHIIDSHRRSEEAAETALALELAGKQRQVQLLNSQLEAFKQLQKHTTDGGGAGSADGGGGAVANYNHPDLNAVFALMRKDTAKLEFEMQKSQADYNAQKHGVLMEDPGSSASDLNKAAFAMVKAFQDRLQRNKMLGDREKRQRTEVDEIDKKILAERAKMNKAADSIPIVKRMISLDLIPFEEESFLNQFEENVVDADAGDAAPAIAPVTGEKAGTDVSETSEAVTEGRPTSAAAAAAADALAAAALADAAATAAADALVAAATPPAPAAAVEDAADFDMEGGGAGDAEDAASSPGTPTPGTTGTLPPTFVSAAAAAAAGAPVDRMETELDDDDNNNDNGNDNGDAGSASPGTPT